MPHEAERERRSVGAAVESRRLEQLFQGGELRPGSVLAAQMREDQRLRLEHPAYPVATRLWNVEKHPAALQKNRHGSLHPVSARRHLRRRPGTREGALMVSPLK